MNTRIDISVVIPVKNGQKYLGPLLKAVFSQEVSAEFEVIIVDSGSTDGSLDIAGRYPVSVYQIKESEFNHGVTRNLGISKARGEYVILMTQDAVPYNNRWMKSLINNLQSDPQVAGAYSRQIPHADSGILQKIRTDRFLTSDIRKRISYIDKAEDYMRLSAKQKYRFCNFDNVSSCIRKSVWHKFSFPKTDFAEDLEWSKSVLEAGYKIIYEPDSIVCHCHNFSVREWLQKNRVNSRKLCGLFGVHTIDRVYKIPVYFFVYTLRGIYYLFKYGKNTLVSLSNIFWVSSFSCASALGQYLGIRDSKRSGTKIL